MKQHMVLLCMAMVLALSLQAQTTGDITGTVTDPSGGVISGAVVKVVNVATNQIREVATNQVGVYTVPFLVPAVYDIQVSVHGFREAVRRGVTLQVGALARIDFRMEVGAVSEVVEVAGAAPLLSSESVAVGTVIENRRIVELPLNGRNYLQLVSLSPNVVNEGGGGGAGMQGGERARQSISVAGQRLEFNRYTLDGVENTDGNFNTYMIRPSIEALQEFNVQTGIYSAEFGRATSQINVTTKPGSNEFHGSVFEFLRNSALDAKEWNIAGNKNPFRRNQFGFTLGGRLIRDKLFFLSNFEALRDRKAFQFKVNVATDKMRAGDFSGISQAIYDPLTRVFVPDAQGNPKAVSATQFPGNKIPASQLHPISKQLLEFYPAATVPGDSILSNYQRNSSRPIDSEQFTQRIDFAESSSSSWFGRLSWGDEYEGDASAFESSEGRVQTRTWQTVLSNTRTFGTSVVNEFRFGYNQFQNDRVGHYAYIRNVQGELPIKGLPPAGPDSWGAPSISFGSSGLSGRSESDPHITRNHTFQWLDTVSIVRGKHSMKLGGEFRRDRINEFGNLKSAGELQFHEQATFDPANRQKTGYGFASFMLGWTSESAFVYAAANSMFRGSAGALFFQDDWKITPKLTMNIGIRYENSPPKYDKYRGIINVQIFDMGVGPNGLLPADQTRVPVLVRPGSGDFYEGMLFRFHDGIPIAAGDQHMGRALVYSDNNDFAPRIGFAYSPTGKWTFRTGYGVFFTQDTGNPRYDMSRNLAGRGVNQADTERPNAPLDDPWREQKQRFTCSNWAGACLGPPQVLGNDVARRTPYIHQWLFNIQRQVTSGLAAEVGYQGNAGHKLESFRVYDNPVLKTGPNDARTIVQRQPWPAYNRIQMVNGRVNANYHALSTKLTQRFAHGLTYLCSFTWSKAIDSGSAIRTNSGDNLWPRNSYDLHHERGLSQFHMGRRLATSFMYELPFGDGKPLTSDSVVLRKLISGWQVGSILTFGDGTPTNVATIGDNASLNQLGSYPNASGISPFPDKITPQRFWVREAIDTTAAELAWLPGNVGRNVLIKPGSRQWDFSLVKRTSIREGHSLEFRMEAFNAGNHPNWNSPSTNARSGATFGVVTSARTMREIQFGLKYLF